jgi:hypothetical protein
MSAPVEGVHASYVGPDDAKTGILTGDRCYVLSDERSLLYVKWTTGAQRGSYAQVRPHDIVADAMAEEEDDGFVFEPRPRVAINVTGVYQAGGEVALFEALESQGHLDSLRDAVTGALRSIRAALDNDEDWKCIRTALGEHATVVESSAIIAAMAAATSEE